MKLITNIYTCYSDVETFLWTKNIIQALKVKKSYYGCHTWINESTSNIIFTVKDKYTRLKAQATKFHPWSCVCIMMMLQDQNCSYIWPTPASPHRPHTFWVLYCKLSFSPVRFPMLRWQDQMTCEINFYLSLTVKFWRKFCTNVALLLNKWMNVFIWWQYYTLILYA